MKIRALLTPFYADNGLTLPPEKAPPPPTAPAPAPEPPPPAEPSALASTMYWGGAAAVVVGTVVAVVGVLPSSDYQNARQTFTDLKDVGDVAGAAEARGQAELAADAWNSWGISCVIAGAGLVVAGGTAFALSATGVVE